MDEFERLIKEHSDRRPLMRARDYYKLLHQGVFGVGHIMGSDALDRLREEAERVKNVGPRDEPLLERVSPDGSMLRVNLRPFLQLGGSLEALYCAMVESSKVMGDPARFLRLWRRFKQVAGGLEIALDEGEVREIDDALGERGPVPLHHTVEYRETHYPAYRVVRRVDLETAGLTLSTD